MTRPPPNFLPVLLLAPASAGCRRDKVDGTSASEPAAAPGDAGRPKTAPTEGESGNPTTVRVETEAAPAPPDPYAARTAAEAEK